MAVPYGLIVCYSFHDVRWCMALGLCAAGTIVGWDILRKEGLFIMAQDSDRVNKVVYGPDKKDGGHDHRYNRDNDRTPSQKSGDESRRK